MLDWCTTTATTGIRRRTLPKLLPSEQVLDFDHNSDRNWVSLPVFPCPFASA